MRLNVIDFHWLLLIINSWLCNSKNPGSQTQQRFYWKFIFPWIYFPGFIGLWQEHQKKKKKAHFSFLKKSKNQFKSMKIENPEKHLN